MSLQVKLLAQEVALLREQLAAHRDTTKTDDAPS
jgi:hypothetical protein